MAQIPAYQKAAWVSNPGPRAQVEMKTDAVIAQPGEGEVLVKIEFSGVCHSDVHNIRGYTPMTTNIAGHEGVGRIVKVGTGVSEDHLNKRAGIKWLYSWCQQCEICTVDYTVCPNQHNSGRDVPGTFQEYVVSPLACLTIIPDAIKSEIAAPLLCAGITAYSAVLKPKLSKNEWIAISGAGGGLGHLAVQIAKGKGYKVIAIDTGEKKRQLCLELGADSFIDFLADDVVAKVKGVTGEYGAHATICMATSQDGYKQALELLRHGGTLVCIGLCRETLPISPFELLVRGQRVMGSAVGTEEEIQDLFKLVLAGKVSPEVEVFDFNDIGEVLHKLEHSQVSGRAVVRIL